MTTLDVLRAARDLISDPARWARGYWAFDIAGNKVDPDQPYAVRWCATGAVNKVALPDHIAAYNAIDALINGLSSEYAYDLFSFNDYTSHAEVLALFDTAIARLEAEVQS